jgi:hypothetical protein
MDLRRARAPIALIMLLALGIWASSAFADRVVSAVTTAVTDTAPTDTTATSPGTDTTGTTTSPVTETTPTETATAPVVTSTTPAATTPTPVASPSGATDTPATAGDPIAGSNTLAAATGGQTATPGAATASAASAIAKASGTHRTKTHRARSSGAAALTPRPIKAPRGGIVSRARPRHAPASRSHTKRKGKTATTTTTTAPHSRVAPVHLAKAKARRATRLAHARGGREAVASNQQPAPSAHEHGGIGFETPSGRLSISPSGFHFGSSQRSIASVDGLVTAVLDTLAVLAALAALIGAAAVLSLVRRTRQAARERARVAPANRRTRAELYAEARRQNLPGRSSMTKAELERALYPPQPVRERRPQRVPRFDALAWMRHLRGPLPRGGSRGSGR